MFMKQMKFLLVALMTVLMGDVCYFLYEWG